MRAKLFCLLTVVVLTVSCARRVDNDRIKIANYSIGDKIDKNDFDYENHMDSAVLVGDCVSDKRLTVFTWNDTIVSLFYTLLTKTEFDSISKLISSKLKLQPEIRQGTTKEGIKILEQESYWLDSLNGDEITIGYREIKPDSVSCGLIIENKRFCDKILPKVDDKIEMAK